MAISRLKKGARRAKMAAFTLIEMIIAITVFTIFIGFAISAYLAFHRADQDALVVRALLMEEQGIMDKLSSAVKENRIAYSAYKDSVSGENIETANLYLLSADKKNIFVYSWDSDAQMVQLQAFDSTSGAPLDGYADPIQLNSENAKVSYLEFKIFPSVDPYADENKQVDNVQFQPVISIDMTMEMPGRVQEKVSVSLHTAATSRYYK